MSEFNKERTGSGTKEWAEHKLNICVGCSNNCLYFYAAANAKRYKQRERKDWHIEAFNKQSNMKSYPSKKGVVMFPTSHDITPFNVDEYIRVARLILEKGNMLLIVSKPRLECIFKLCEDLKQFKDQILFRFTIGTMCNNTSVFWEPGAPLPKERIECLSLAFSLGFKTSVSIEPMLAGCNGAESVVIYASSFVTDTIWIGKMNKIRLRVNMNIPANRRAVNMIDDLQNDQEIMALYRRLKDNQIIRWKDSIRTVISFANQA